MIVVLVKNDKFFEELKNATGVCKVRCVEKHFPQAIIVFLFTHTITIACFFTLLQHNINVFKMYFLI